MSIISGMPQICDAFSGWFQPITVTQVTQTIVNGLVTPTLNSVPFFGCIQPLSPKRIALKPEGERAWSWLQVHMRPPAAFDVGSILVYNNKNYKVMGQNDYSLNGFIEFELVADYQ